VQGFAILDDGELVPLGPPQPVGDDPSAARVDPTGRFLYIANGGQEGGGPGGTISIFSIDTRNGTLTQVIPGGTAPGGPLALSFAPTGARLYVPVVQLESVLPYEIAAAGGTLSLIGTGTPALVDPVDLAISPTGRFAYVVLQNGGEQGSVQLFDLRVSDGALYNASDDSFTPRQSLPVGPDPVGIVIEPHENFLYVADSTSDEVWRIAIADDGTLTALGTNPGGLMPSDLELTTRVE
jgi:DNA-binding beta-propeller fold protein YncE